MVRDRNLKSAGTCNREIQMLTSKIADLGAIRNLSTSTYR